MVLGETNELQETIERVSKLRKQILEMREDSEAAVLKKRGLLAQADEAADRIRNAGDLAVAAFFGAKSKKEKKVLRETYLEKRSKLPENLEWQSETLRNLEALHPFHWELEFPEVFTKNNTGFDCIIGNPPFRGGHLISGDLGVVYFSFLKTTYPPAGHYCDLVAYFFRRGFSLLKPKGTLGLIATKTIAFGDSRNGGLRHILREGGWIYSAERRRPWPGSANVLISIINIISNGRLEPILDEIRCKRISAFLLEGTQDNDPDQLEVATRNWSKGSQIYGQGFLFEDGNPKATNTSEMRELIKEDPSLSKRIRPFIGGREILSQATPRHHRWVIYLSDLKTYEQLDEWPRLKQIVEEKVKPERLRLGSNPVNRPLKKRWWAYQAHRPGLYASIKEKDRVLVVSEVSKHLAFTFLPANMIYSHKLVVFNIQSYAEFGVMQSRVHETWTSTFSSARGDGFNYAASDCYTTFPFPKHTNVEKCNSLSKIYFSKRNHISQELNEGLTKIYNRFHDPEEDNPRILELRQLHGEMDKAVLAAYGWDDIATDCEFIPDFYEEDDQGNPVPKNIRYRWPDEVRDEVLARLLDLNTQRAREEAQGDAVFEPAPVNQLAQHKDHPKAAAALKKDLPGLDDLPRNAYISLLQAESELLEGDNLDFAPTCMAYCKALEITLFEAVFGAFHKHMAEHPDRETLIQRPENKQLASKTVRLFNYIEKVKPLELGTMTLVLNTCRGKTATKVPLVAELASWLESQDLAILFDKDTTTALDHIATTWRNPAAHSKAFKLKDAQAAREAVIGLLEPLSIGYVE